MALSYSMDKIGPLARSAEDCARVFAAIAGHDFSDRGTLPIDKAAFTYSASLELGAKPLRIGLLTNAWKKFDSAAEKVYVSAEKNLRKYFPAARATTLPEGPWEDAAAIIIGVEGAAAFRDLIRSGKVKDLTDPLSQIAGYVNEQIAGADYVRALQVREILQRKMTELFDTFDVIVAASQPIAATPLEANLETDVVFPDPLGAIGNLCGLPALSVPCGFTDKNLPVGMQFLARAGNDAAVIQAARAFQQHTDWHRRRPKLR
jgi:aspartyl-tRNA(Asn)/glutamyl-tRNA(Gln) amidotransferase subunit A